MKLSADLTEEDVVKLAKDFRLALVIQEFSGYGCFEFLCDFIPSLFPIWGEIAKDDTDDEFRAFFELARKSVTDDDFKKLADIMVSGNIDLLRGKA